MTTTIILLLVIITATCFDFTNGFHDTGNAMATSIVTRALSPKTSVAISAILNLVGAFLSYKVAVGVTKNILILQTSDGNLLPGLNSQTALTIIFAGLIGGILWNLITWLFGLPSSSTHALFGGLIGAGIVSPIVSPNWIGLISKVIIPAVLSPCIAGIVSAIGTFLVYAITKNISASTKNKGFKIGQICTASLISLAHGTSDAQKTMGVIALSLIATKNLDPVKVYQGGIPAWIIILCAAAMAIGTYLGGWRVIRTLGKGLVEIDSPQGFAADASSTVVILAASAQGLPLSTTHIATGSILGSGVGKPGARVRWSVAAKMLISWIITLPSAAIFGAIAVGITDLIPGLGGALILFGILVIISAYILYTSHKNKVDATNVNDDWIDDNHHPNNQQTKNHSVHPPLSEPDLTQAV